MNSVQIIGTTIASWTRNAVAWRVHSAENTLKLNTKMLFAARPKFGRGITNPHCSPSFETARSLSSGRASRGPVGGLLRMSFRAVETGRPHAEERTSRSMANRRRADLAQQLLVSRLALSRAHCLRSKLRRGMVREELILRAMPVVAGPFRLTNTPRSRRAQNKSPGRCRGFQFQVREEISISQPPGRRSRRRGS